MPDAKGNSLPDPEKLPEGSDPIIAWATIVQSESEDHAVQVVPEYVGTRIAVNLRSTCTGTMYNKETKQYHRREIIYKIDPETDWIPTELLEFDPGDYA